MEVEIKIWSLCPHNNFIGCFDGWEYSCSFCEKKMKFKTGDLVCVERKRKNKRKNKWERWSRIYIVLNETKAMGFRAEKPIEINLEQEIEKGNRIQKVYSNIGKILKDHWKVSFDSFFEEFFQRID